MIEAKQKVLLVDDDEEDYMIIRDMFSDFPQQTLLLEWVQSFKQAKEIMQKNAFDVYLVDYRLGVNTGLDLISEARTSSTGPIILLTGQGDHDIDVEAMQRGADDYLVKSQLSAPLLERSIRYAVKRGQIMQELKESENSVRRLYDERLQMEAQILQQDRLASVGLLASSLAHEIGTPLGVMRGRSEMIQMEAKDNPSIAKNADIIVSQIDRISKLIRSLLNLARGEDSNLPAAVNVNDVLGDVTDLLAPEFSRYDIVYKNEIPEHVLVMAESGSLHQVFLNLFVNSIHAIQSVARSGRGGPHFIRVGAESGESGWQIQVSDTGCGISSENMKMLFKPFFTTKKIGEGTGLGLATSYRLVEGWGGKMEVESEFNVGTTFKIFLKNGMRKPKEDANEQKE